ncbi:MAG: hypothetical protein L0Y60_03585 [Beijerinckiaceae bacterium]|nr:hypothetical protein [Beijerinckiaceae bacterium]
MAHGGRREGSGRRKGSLNRKTQAIAKDMIASGALTPLEVMMKAMKVHADARRWDQAAMIAKDAAPYIHPRLAAIQHAGADGGPIETKDVSLPELARRIALILGQAARQKAEALKLGDASNGGN